MNPIRKQRLEELRKLFNVTEIGSKEPPRQVINDTITRYLNKRNGKQVVVPKNGKSRMG